MNLLDNSNTEYHTDLELEDHLLIIYNISNFWLLLFSGLNFTFVKMIVKTVSWALKIHYSFVSYLREGESEFLIKITLSNEFNCHANLPKASLVETNVSITSIAPAIRIWQSACFFMTNSSDCSWTVRRGNVDWQVCQIHLKDSKNFTWKINHGWGRSVN